MQQIIFDAPYNRQKRLPRMFRWCDWRKLVYPMLGKSCPPEIYAGSYDEYCGLTNGKGMLRVPLPLKLVRDSSHTSTMSAEEVQRQHDMMQPPLNGNPLNPEEIATIVSGSLSLMNGSCDEDEGDQSDQGQALKDKAKKRNEDYQKTKQTTDWQERLRADSTEIEGVYVFRPSYNIWKDQSCAKARDSPAPTAFPQC